MCWNFAWNTVPRGVFPNPLPREQEVYWIFMIFEDHSFNITPVASEYKEIHPYSVVNIDIVKINTTMMREWPILKKAWLHVKNLVFSNTRYTKYPMILKINRVRIGYWKIFRVRVGYRVPVGPCNWRSRLTSFPKRSSSATIVKTPFLLFKFQTLLR